MVALPIEVHASRNTPLGMPAAQFLREYWQKRPLLVRGAFPDWQNPLSPEDLAGLACEELALARLIRFDRVRDRWSVEQGPFDEAIFPDLPTQDWTLLVQDVDKWDADVRRLLAAFDFLPRWRLDDVMVSFAAPGGGVGAHTDHYDVFLIQGEGRRRWRIDARPNPAQAFKPDVELKQLQSFEASHDWVLEPGDMLYLPPEIPHDGVAVDACMTFSVGMRAPSQAELLGALADHLERHDAEAARYADPDLSPRRSPSAILPEDLDRARTALESALQLSSDDFTDWFGELVTRYRSSGLLAPPPSSLSTKQLQSRLHRGARLVAHPFTRLAWSTDGRRTRLYAHGEGYECEPSTAERLCLDQPLDAAGWEALNEQGRALAVELLNRGHFALESARAGRTS